MPKRRPGSGGHSKTGKRAIDKSDDTALALDMKRSGQSFREISIALGRSVGWVHSAITQYIANTPSPNLEAYRHEARERHEAIIAAHWDKRGQPYNAKAIQDSEKILMAIMGAEAPKKAELTISQEPNEQLLDRITRLVAAATASEGDSEPELGGCDGDPAPVAALGSS